MVHTNQIRKAYLIIIIRNVLSIKQDINTFENYIVMFSFLQFVTSSIS